MAYSGVYVFGDSLVDAGNALKLAQWYSNLTFSDLPDGAPTAQKGYFEGRFSDGYTYADLIANKAIGTVTKPVFPYGYEDPWIGVPIAPFATDPSGNNLNFAYGGAQVRQGDEVVQDLDSQTDTFRNAVDGNAPSDALYIVTMGGNDVRNLATVNGTPQPPVAGGYAALDKVVQQLIHELGQLIDDGARNFLITGCADVGFIPDYDTDNSGDLDASEQLRSTTATAYSQYLDLKIETVVVPALQAKGATVTYVSMTNGLDAVLPTLEALHDLAPGTLTTDRADHSNLLAHRDLVFFDDIHPNAQVQALFGSYAQSILRGAPWIEILPVAGTEVDYGLIASISAAGEVDKLVIALAAGVDYRFDMLGISTLGSAGSLGDPSLRLLTSGGAVAGANADDGAGFDAVLTFRPAGSGTYTLEMSATGSLTGAYGMQLSLGSAAMTAGQTYVVSNAAAIVVEGAGWAGVDVVQASISYALKEGAEIELLTTTNARGKGAINLTGNTFDQQITGNAGANVLEGKGGADTFTGGGGKDVFVLGGGMADAITDYERGEIVDISQALSVGAGTNVIAGGFVRVTTGGLIQVDVNGGGNDWVTLSSVNGTSAVTLRYLSGGTAATVTASRVAATSLLAAGAAAAGMMVMPAASHDGGGGTATMTAASLPAQDAYGGLSAIDAEPARAMLGNEVREYAALSPLQHASIAITEGHGLAGLLALAPDAWGGAGMALDGGTELAAAPLPPLPGVATLAMHSEVAAIVADALGGGGAPVNVDALLDALPAPGLAIGLVADMPAGGFDGLAAIMPGPDVLGLAMLAVQQDAPVTV